MPGEVNQGKRQRLRVGGTKPTKHVLRPPSRQGWSGESLRERARLYGESGLARAHEDAFLAECSNLVDTVIKSCYAGVNEDHYDNMHADGLQKCWRGLIHDWRRLAYTFTDPGARLYTAVRNTLRDYWRALRCGHAKYTSSLNEAHSKRPQHHDNPVQKAIYHEARSTIHERMQNHGDTLRLRFRLRPIYDEYVAFYFAHSRSPAMTEITAASVLGCDLVAFQAVAYHFRKHMQRAWAELARGR